MNTKGIYIILNKINLKFYIGGTTTSFNHRRNGHYGSLKNKSHSNYRLQNDWNRFKEHNFIFYIEKRLNDDNEIQETEQWYLDEYKPWDPKIGYNIKKMYMIILLGIFL